MKLDISGYNGITFQGCKLHWNSSFLMGQPKQSWQYWHGEFVKNPNDYGHQPEHQQNNIV